MTSVKQNPRFLFVFVAIMALLLLVTTAACGGSDSDGGDATATAGQGTSGPDQAPTPSPFPEPTPQPNRADCAAINGTPLLSAAEGDWFAANCAFLDGPTVPPGANNAQVPIGDRLVIPSAGINTDVSRSTVTASGQMPDPVGYFNAVWYDFSGWPGHGGYV